MKKPWWWWTRPVPKHPYRDTLVIYALLAGVVVAVSAATNGPVLKALLFAGVAFVAGTLYSWWYWRDRLRKEKERGER
jgi:hypothetical protein